MLDSISSVNFQWILTSSVHDNGNFMYCIKELASK